MRRMEPPARRELAAVFAFTLLGAAIRLWGFGGLGLSHFDEGIYALAGAWSLSPGGLAGLDPLVIPYAPPGFPILVGIAYLVLGIADVSAILASTACGIATIPAAAWVARRTFGPGAGAAAAALSAGSMAHVAFSRKALTDSSFALAWLVAIGLGGRFLERPTIGRAVAVGLAVGLAQNLKYNGWLLGIVLVGAAVLGALREPAPRDAHVTRIAHVFSLAGLVLLAGAIALLLYAPWFAFVERHGGYAALVRHHRGYLAGPASWLPNWTQQLAQSVALSGSPAWNTCRFLAAWLAAGWTLRQDAPPAPMSLLAGVFVAAFLSAATANLGWWAGLAFVPWLAWQARPASQMVGLWWILLSVLTPFYHPYARLWLPLDAAGWLILAGLAVRLSPYRGRSAAVSAGGQSVPNGVGPEAPGWLLGGVLLAASLGVWEEWQARARPLPFARLFQGTAGLRDVAQDLPRLVPPGSPLHVLARRPLAFYLLSQGRYPVRLLAGIDDVNSSVPAGGWAIVDGALLDDETRRGLESAPAEVTYREWLDPVTLLDVAPGSAFRESERGPVRVLLLRRGSDQPPVPLVRPPAPGSHPS